MTDSDELWTWIQTPVRELVAARVAEPDKTWPDLRAYFLDRAGLVNAEDHPLTDGFLTRLDDMTDDDRNGLLDDGDRLEAVAYEVVTEVAAADTTDAADGTADETADAADDGSYDEAAWQSFLTEHGPHWNGEEESWSQFREWFLFYANENGVGTPATGLLALLDSQDAQQRIATFAQYGVTITPAAAPAVELTDADVQTLLDETADFDDIPEERRRELIQQIAQERQ